MMHLATETSLVISAQSWCDLLTMDLSAISIHKKSDIKAAKCHQVILALLTPQIRAFSGYKDSKHFRGTCHLAGR